MSFLIVFSKFLVIFGCEQSKLMADRVHPISDQLEPSPNETNNVQPKTRSDSGSVRMTNPNPSFAPKPTPTPGTYVVHVPKDQIYRVPSPENDRLYRRYTRRRPGRGRFRRYCCCAVALLLLAAAVLAAVFYLTVRPRSLRYSIVSVSARGFNLTLPGPISPDLAVGIRADNPNRAIGVYYRRESSVAAKYGEAELARGALPEFYHRTRNVTELTVELTASGLMLGDAASRELTTAERERNIPLELEVRAPVRVKVWRVQSWTMVVRVKCKVGLDKLAEDARVVSARCRVRVNPFPW